MARTLVPSDDPVKVKTLKWLFDQYANTSIGLRSLADSLNERGIPAPGGDSWWIGHSGDSPESGLLWGLHLGKTPDGKYRRVSGTTVKKRESLEMTPGGNPSVKRNTPEEWIVVRDAHPRWWIGPRLSLCKRSFPRRKRRTASRRKSSDARYLLSGIVRPPHCGEKMYGTRTTRRKPNRIYEYHKYHCSTYHTQGKARCSHNTIDEAPLTQYLVGLLRQMILGSDNKAAFRRVVRERINARLTKRPGNDGQH